MTPEDNKSVLSWTSGVCRVALEKSFLPPDDTKVSPLRGCGRDLPARCPGWGGGLGQTQACSWPSALPPTLFLPLLGHLLPSLPVLEHDLGCQGPRAGPQSAGHGSPTIPILSLGLGCDWATALGSPDWLGPLVGVSLAGCPPNLFGASSSTGPHGRKSEEAHRLPDSCPSDNMRVNALHCFP